MGVSVLTSLDESELAQVGISRTVEDQMIRMSNLAIKCGIDGVISSPLEIISLRTSLGTKPLIVTPGIRLPGGESHDQKRFATPHQAIADGASFLVMGRALTDAEDLDFVIDQLK